MYKIHNRRCCFTGLRVLRPGFLHRDTRSRYVETRFISAATVRTFVLLVAEKADVCVSLVSFSISAKWGGRQTDPTSYAHAHYYRPVGF